MNFNEWEKGLKMFKFMLCMFCSFFSASTRKKNNEIKIRVFLIWNSLYEKLNLLILILWVSRLMVLYEEVMDEIFGWKNLISNFSFFFVVVTIIILIDSERYKSWKEFDES